MKSLITAFVLIVPCVATAEVTYQDKLRELEGDRVRTLRFSGNENSFLQINRFGKDETVHIVVGKPFSFWFPDSIMRGAKKTVLWKFSGWKTASTDSAELQNSLLVIAVPIERLKTQSTVKSGKILFKVKKENELYSFDINSIEAQDGFSKLFK